MSKKIIALSIITLLIMSGCSDSAMPAETDGAYTSPSPTEEINNSSAQSVKDMEYILRASFGDRTGSYSGELLDGLPHGNGVFVCVNPEGIGWIYTGEFQGGHFNGDGITVWDTGSKREGRFYMDVMIEGGIYADDGTLIYEGVLENGQPPSLTDEEITIMLVEPDRYIGRTVVDLPLKLIINDKVEGDNGYDGYTVVGGAGLKDLFPVSFGSESKLSASIDSYIFVSGTIAGNLGRIIGDDDTKAVWLESVIAVDPAYALLENKDNITLADFSRAKEGMSYAAVAYIFGKDGELQSESGNAKVYQWVSEMPIGANAIITFQDDKLVSSAQAGLE